MSASPALTRWAARRTYGPEDVPTLEGLRACKFATASRVAVVVPVAADSGVAGQICAAVHRDLIAGAGLADRLIVATANPDSWAAHAAADAGAMIVTSFGRGRGDALRAAIHASGEDVLVWVDATTRNFSPRIVARLLAPLLLNQDLMFVKGFTTKVSPKSGGRAGDRLARPLLAAHFPALGGYSDPLLREGAARGALLRALPVESGDGVEAGLLIDAFLTAGLDAMGRVDLGRPIHRARPIAEDETAAAGVIVRRAEERGLRRAFADAPARPLLARLPVTPAAR